MLKYTHKSPLMIAPKVWFGVQLQLRCKVYSGVIH